MRCRYAFALRKPGAQRLSAQLLDRFGCPAVARRRASRAGPAGWRPAPSGKVSRSFRRAAWSFPSVRLQVTQAQKMDIAPAVVPGLDQRLDAIHCIAGRCGPDGAGAPHPWQRQAVGKEAPHPCQRQAVGKEVTPLARCPCWSPGFSRSSGLLPSAAGRPAKAGTPTAFRHGVPRSIKASAVHIAYSPPPLPAPSGWQGGPPFGKEVRPLARGPPFGTVAVRVSKGGRKRGYPCLLSLSPPVSPCLLRICGS
jgi:hypothetical protein